MVEVIYQSELSKLQEVKDRDRREESLEAKGIWRRRKMMLGGGGGGVGGGSGDGDALGGRMAMLPPQLNRSWQQQTRMGKEERVAQAQWTEQETRELIGIRGDLERDFTVARWSKTLWEAVATRMRERGYRRTSDQCKCKWKNLVNRYKDTETADPENGRQCPFFEELHAVFTERARNMQRLQLESESSASPSKRKLKRLGVDRSSGEFSEDDDEDDEDSDEEHLSKSRKKKADRGAQQQQQQQRTKASGSIHGMLQEFLQQQQRVEVQWREVMERRAQERRAFEQEWRRSMEKLESERLMLERAWRERDEQRRMREESRAEKRDALLTTLLNKLIQDDF